MTTYCAPCLADLALVREAVTSVNGTAACIAHAVLLTHPTDTPQRRLTRLGDLRSTAEEKLATASQDDVPAIELLIQEYALAGAMDMTVPLKDIAGDRQPRQPKNRGRGRDGRDGRGERGERGEGRRDGRPERGERGERQGGQDRGPREQAPSGEAAADTGPTNDTPAPVDTAPAPVEAAPVEVSAPAPETPPAVEALTASAVPESAPSES